MKSNNYIIYGLFLTFLVFILSNSISILIGTENAFFPPSFLIHTSMMIFSILLILLFLKNKDDSSSLSFSIKKPKLKKALKTIFITMLFVIGFQISMVIVFSFFSWIFGFNSSDSIAESSPFQMQDPLQVILFVFIYASICEELLFRGFLQNMLSPVRHLGLKIYKIRVSLPVIISAFLFGAAHLILLLTGANPPFVLMIVFYAFILGLPAGYYQEKYDNFIYAVIVHSIGNIPAVLGSFFNG